MAKTKPFSTQAERAGLLTAAQDAQTVYWAALRRLEKAYSDNAEIDGETLSNHNVTTLDEAMQEAGTDEHAVVALGIGEGA